MDYSRSLVLIEPIILGDLVTEDDQVSDNTNSSSAVSEFLENFRRNQVVDTTTTGNRGSSSAGNGTDAQEEDYSLLSSLVIIRASSDRNRRNFVLYPIVLPPLISNRVIPLPEFPPERNTGSNNSSSYSSSILATAAAAAAAIVLEGDPEGTVCVEDMVSLRTFLNCECPVPGSKPLVVCNDCRRRERKKIVIFFV
jgi:hypothetical protein